jgi:hypothetical protein
MKDVIGSAMLIVSLLLGTGKALSEVHNMVRKAALQKAAQGLPSLTKMTRALRVKRTGD